MFWMDWVALKHELFVHLPLAAALMAPLALIAAQRPGRGIKPWWTTARYVTWVGVIGGITAVISGWIAAQHDHLLPEGQWIVKGPLRHATVFQLHQWFAIGSLVLGILSLKALHRKREEHQGIGVLGLFLGILWCASTVMAGYYGDLLSHPLPIKIQPLPASSKPAPVVDPEPSAPLRALNYMNLIPIQAEPVKSADHGNRWIRVWADSKAAGSYREGKPLPEGSMVVMTTVEDRWGRPGFDPGPLYALEIKPGGKPSLTFYWPNVPEGRRHETLGQNHAYWRGDDPNLASCLSCHEQGPADAKDRSHWTIPRPKLKSTDGAAK